MRKILLRIAYDGSAYHGWQKQDNADTVEGRMYTALSELCPEAELCGGSRTDAGVHARDNVVLCITPDEFRIPADKLPMALNRRLPGDICVCSGEERNADFELRGAPCRKTYEYRILNTAMPDPMRRLYCAHVSFPLDENIMAEGAAHLVGEHDFTSFSSVHAQVQTRVRTIFSAEVERHGDEILIRVCGNGFLYNMVRIIAGTLVELGRGACAAEDIKRMLDAKDRQAAGPTAVPEGLCLKRYELL